ncbi:MAG: molybdopterin-dependent oxidoreductase [Magnetococcales bacterium]|nr:molybdopterin-dependent oxidoreductase [Magnetococcales bacterium]
MADLSPIATTCPYCGTGCGILLQPDGHGGIASMRGDPLHPANYGRLCSKGSALLETIAMDGRLLAPKIRGEVVTWERALEAVAHGFASTIRQHGPESVAFYLSGQLLTEDYYVANKLMKGFIGAANIDSNSRLCMASAVVGHKRAFGEDLMPCCYEDLELAKLVVIAGSNTAWCHPVLFQRLQAARQADPSKKLVVIDPRRTATAQAADLHLPLIGGSDAVLWLGLLHYIIQHGHAKTDYFKNHTEMEAYTLELAAAYASDPPRVAKATGLDPSSVTAFYELFCGIGQSVTLFSQGINQSAGGSDKVNAIINCHLATGRIGQPGMGPFSLTGQPNAMGGREVGAMANQLAAHMGLDNPAHRERVGRFWGSKLVPRHPGRLAMELFQAMESGQIKAVWIMGTNPMVSLPNTAQVRRALERCPLVVVSEAVAQTDTTALAHILLPAQTWGEKSGTVTNSERCISRQRSGLAPVGLAQPDWWQLCQVAKRLGHSQAFDFHNPAAIFREHAALSGFENQGERVFDLSLLASLTDEAYDALSPVQWPLWRDDQGVVHGTPRLGAGKTCSTPNGRARLVEVLPRKPATPTSRKYPLILNTGRLRDQWHTMTRTGVAPRLCRHGTFPVAEIHPDDGQRYGLTHGALARISTPAGSLITRIIFNPDERSGQLFMAMHWNHQFAGQGTVNLLVPAKGDPHSGQPEFKRSPAKVEPLARCWHGFLLRRSGAPLAQNGLWWGRQPLEHGVWLYHLEGTEALESWQAQSSLWLEAGAEADQEWMEFSDAAHYRFRRALLRKGRLEGILFIEAKGTLPKPEGLASLFQHQHLEGQARQRLLVGRGSAQDYRPVRTICACMGVSAEQIQQALVEGTAPTISAIGARLKAGSNCGSCLPEVREILLQWQQRVA